MKYLSMIFPCWMLLCVLMACSSSEEEKATDTPAKAETTVIIYMAADNNLSSNADSNLVAIAKASAASNLSNNHLVAFVDKQSAVPYIASFKDGKETKDTHYICNENFISANPEKMYETLAWIQTRYPANNYALILWGHSSGWLTENDTIAVPQQSILSHAYGIDNGTWINIPTLATVLNKLKRFKYIMADCCNFQCIEVAYELRNCCEYIIGSPAEEPSQGIPYDILTPLLFNTTEQNILTMADCIFGQTVSGKH
ncbi:MAG: clostripain-related cysteine peptidase, partial [Prevotella sp.]